MAKSNNSSGYGIGLPTLIFLIFLVLKLAEIGKVATWSWWWVTSPLWIPIPIVIIYLIIAGVIVAIKLVEK